MDLATRWSNLFVGMSPASFFNFSFLPKYGVYFLQALGYTLLLAVISVLLAVIPALLLAFMRLSKNKFVRGISGAYIAIFRSTPLLVQLSIIYFGFFGAISIPRLYIFGFIDISRFIPGVVALALNSSAYVAEIFRAGILAVDAGQTEAARSLGLSATQAMKLVVLPQAIKNVLPALGNEVVTMVKESSICSTLGMVELMFAAKTVATSTYISLAPYVLAALMYFCITYPAGKAIEALERRMRRGDKHYFAHPRAGRLQGVQRRQRPRALPLQFKREKGRGRGHHRPLRQRQIDTAALPEPS